MVEIKRLKLLYWFFEKTIDIVFHLQTFNLNNACFCTHVLALTFKGYKNTLKCFLIQVIQVSSQRVEVMF